MNNILNVKVITPTRTIFDGQALSVSGENGIGNFDILPFHANFIALIRDEPITIRFEKNSQNDKQILSLGQIENLIRKNAEKLVFNFPIAIIYTKNNIVKIYTDIQSHYKDQNDKPEQSQLPK